MVIPLFSSHRTSRISCPNWLKDDSFRTLLETIKRSLALDLLWRPLRCNNLVQPQRWECQSKITWYTIWQQFTCNDFATWSTTQSSQPLVLSTMWREIEPETQRQNHQHLTIWPKNYCIKKSESAPCRTHVHCTLVKTFHIRWVFCFSLQN